MNKKSKKTLKNAFNIPEPNRKEIFFDSLEIKSERRFTFRMPLYLSTAVTALIVIGVWGGVKNLPYFEQPETIDTPSYSESTSLPDNNNNNNNTENTTVRTTAVSVTGKTTVQTSASGTVTGTEHSTQTTVASETVNTKTTRKENNNRPPEELPEIQVTDVSPENTSGEVRTTATTGKATTVRTTATSRTTTGKTATSTRATETMHVNFVTTTTRHTTTTQSEFDPDVLSPTTTTTMSEDNSIFPVTYPSGGATDVPVVIDTEPVDYTVSPPVRYYPDENAINIHETLSNDGLPGTTLRPGNSNEFNNLNWNDLADSSDLIVIATVDEIIYTGIDGKPYTQENIVISEVLYGDIPKNSRISVYGMGGYIPVSDYEIHFTWIEENRMLFDTAGNKTTPQVGDTYLYFIKKSSSYLPDGSYCLAYGTDESKFRYTDSYYMNLNINNCTIMLAELHEYLNN